MNYMKDFFDTQMKMYEDFQKNMTQFVGTKKEGENPMNSFFDMQKQWMETMNTMNTGANPFEAYQKMMENPGFNMDAYKNFIDMQKMYFDNFEKIKEFYPKNMGAFDFSTFDFKNMNEAFNKYQEMFSGYDLNKYLEPQMSGMMDKIYNANKFYLQMYDFWNKINEDFSQTYEADIEKFNQYINSSADTTFKTLMDTLPEEMRVYFSEPRELVVKYLDSISNFYTPWKGEVDHLKDLFIHGTLDNDPEKLSEFFKLWKEKFDETFGKVITSPSFGQNRNVVEQQNKAFDTFIDMFIIASEFSAKLNAVQSDAFKNIIKEYMEITKESTELKTFEEFFNFWSKKMDDRLVSYFSTEEFSKLLTQFGAAAMDFKMETNRLVEQQLSDTPIVTVGQLDSMIKNIYDLKKEIKALKKEVEALKKEATPAGEKKETK